MDYRLKFALDQRGLTRSDLAKSLGVTTTTINHYINEKIKPDIQQLGRILKFPPAFFKSADELPILNDHQISYRGQSKTSNKLRKQAKSLSIIAFMLNDWIEKRFDLKKADLPDLSLYSPEDAAQILRSLWGLGIHPIGNVLELLESKGIRFFSLAIDASEIDAFCTWNESIPFVFLNTLKPADHYRFDCAHELGHLVRDIYSLKHSTYFFEDITSDSLNQKLLAEKRPIEQEANEFAAAFLMPKDALLAFRYQSITSIEQLLELKKFFGVSVAAIVYRLYKLEIISEWTYINELYPKLALSRFEKTVSEPMLKDESYVWQQIYSYLEEEKISVHDIAYDLNLYFKDIADITFGLVSNIHHSLRHLKLVK